MGRTRLFRALALLPLLLLAGCGEGAATQDNAGGELARVPVRVQAVRQAEVQAVYSGTATLEAEREAQVVAKVGGEIRAILVEEGESVAEGALLARLDSDRLQLELDEISANLRKLERDYQRNIELFDQGLVSSGAFESLKFDLEALRAQHDLAELQLSYTELRAPIDGVIARRYVKPGNTITAETAVFHIVDLEPLRAELFVPEREFRKLQPGMPVKVSVDALPGQDFAGLIARVSPVIDPVTGTFKVTVELDDRSRSLKPGMFGRVSIVYDRRNDALLIPRAALLEDADVPYVFAVEAGLARRREVQLGVASGAEIEIRSGLSAADRVVIVGQHGLKDGAAVELVAER